MDQERNAANSAVFTRKAGYIVSNDEGMYTVTMPGDDSEKSYLTATIGTGSFTHYLVRYEPSLFEENA